MKGSPTSLKSQIIVERIEEALAGCSRTNPAKESKKQLQAAATRTQPKNRRSTCSRTNPTSLFEKKPASCQVSSRGWAARVSISLWLGSSSRWDFNFTMTLSFILVCCWERVARENLMMTLVYWMWSGGVLILSWMKERAEKKVKERVALASFG